MLTKPAMTGRFYPSIPTERPACMTMDAADSLIAWEKQKCPDEFAAGTTAIGYFYLCKGEGKAPNVVLDETKPVPGPVCEESVTGPATRAIKHGIRAVVWSVSLPLAGLDTILLLLIIYLIARKPTDEKYLR